MADRCRERRYADHLFIQIYSRMHHFVVKFSKFSSPQAAREHWPPNQNLADALETVLSVSCQAVWIESRDRLDLYVWSYPRHSYKF